VRIGISDNQKQTPRIIALLEKINIEANFGITRAGSDSFKIPMSRIDGGKTTNLTNIKNAFSSLSKQTELTAPSKETDKEKTLRDSINMMLKRTQNILSAIAEVETYGNFGDEDRIQSASVFLALVYGLVTHLLVVAMASASSGKAAKAISMSKTTVLVIGKLWGSIPSYISNATNAKDELNIELSERALALFTSLKNVVIEPSPGNVTAFFIEMIIRWQVLMARFQFHKTMSSMDNNGIIRTAMHLSSTMGKVGPNARRKRIAGK
jgi:hypothetical protein